MYQLYYSSARTSFKPPGDYTQLDMENRSLLQRLFSIEVLAGALAGALLPYAVALAIKVAPTRVPLGVVVVSVGGGALLGWFLLRAVGARRQKHQAEQERKEREAQEVKDQLERIERAIVEIQPARRVWQGRW
jgi:threonine/homoserine/homoserine lactone efflux protein